MNDWPCMDCFDVFLSREEMLQHRHVAHPRLPPHNPAGRPLADLPQTRTGRVAVQLMLNGLSPREVRYKLGLYRAQTLRLYKRWVLPRLKGGETYGVSVHRG